MKTITNREKANIIALRYFPNKRKIWARENIEAIKCEYACLEMTEWKDKQLKESEYYISIPKAEYEELLYIKKQFLISIKDSDNKPTING